MLLNRTEAASFALNSLTTAMPNVVPQPLGGDRYKLWFTGLKSDVDFELHMGETLDAFEESKDVNVLIDYLNAQGKKIQSAIERGADQEPKPVYVNLLPVIRNIDFTVDSAKLFQDKLSNDFKVVYAEVKGGKLNWVTQENIADGFTHDSMSDKAFENLKAMPWVKPERKVNGPGAVFYVFDDKSWPYQSQFLIKAWTEKHLGKRFFFTFPNEHVTLVMVPKQSATREMEQGAVGALARLADDIYHTSDGAITSEIYNMTEDGKIKLFGGGGFGN